MAVQAQYVPNGFYRSPEALEESFLWSNPTGVPPPAANATVLSDHGSELTCNITTAPRKRTRHEPEYHLQSNHFPAAFQTLDSQKRFCKGFQLFQEDTTRLAQSNMTSTTGRASTSIKQDFISNIQQQNHEINNLILLQNEKIREKVKETLVRNQQAILSTLGHQLQKRLKEKESEIEQANRRNVELEEKLKQLVAENQIWFNLAKNNEATVANLRFNLENALQRNLNNPVEGYGDSCDTAESSSCKVASGTCRTCRVAEANVLILPCRHVCVCSRCEPVVGFCPVCDARKDRQVEVFLD